MVEYTSILEKDKVLKSLKKYEKGCIPEATLEGQGW